MQKTSTPNTDDVALLISTKIPTCSADETLEEIASQIIVGEWDEINYVFVLDKTKKLVGVISLANLNKSSLAVPARSVMTPVTVVLKSHEKSQSAVVLAVKNNVEILPVVDGNNVFLGAIISKTIINLMHTEHLEHTLLTSGIVAKKQKMLTIATAGLFDVVRFRLPWLVLGLTAGLGLGLISSWFEDQLKRDIAIAYFIPVVAYIADSVGTQSEAIAVRALATTKVRAILYLIREFFVGVLLGSVIGVLGGIGAFWISGEQNIGIVVGMALFVSSTIAAVLASAIPIIFKLLDKDPALGSGPLATALQDVLSVVIYFLFVVLFL